MLEPWSKQDLPKVAEMLPTAFYATPTAFYATPTLLYATASCMNFGCKGFGQLNFYM